MQDFLGNDMAVGDVVLYIHRTGRAFFKEMAVTPEKLAKVQ